MTLPVGTISMSQVNTELGLASTTNISLNQANVRTLAGVGGSGTIISMDDLRGKTNFTLAFNNADLFYIQSASGLGTTYARIYINTDGSITKNGNYDTVGPTAWGSPLAAGIGSSFEFRVIISSLLLVPDSPTPTFTVAGVDYTGTATTPWYTVSSNRLMEAYSGYGLVQADGTIEIRNISTLTTISRTYTIRASGSAP